MASSSQGSTDQHRPYQGWPYRQPAVIDVPTIDATTAAKWSHLPRKPITLPPPKKDVVISVAKEDGNTINSEDSKQASEEEAPPVVYVPVPDDAESNASTVSRPDDRGEGNPAFVEETIFYDPFENKQIDVRPKPSPEAEVPPEPAPSRPAPQAPASPARPPRPPPPGSLSLHSPGNSSGYGSLSPAAPPSYMQKESQVYGSPAMEDGFSLTPLPVNELPRPPPYSEIEPPRTEVVVVTPVRPEPTQPAAVGLPSSNRKLVQCQHCGLRVHTLMTRENGALTHLLALLTVVLCILPVTALIYCTNCCKYKVHYCPNCNYKIGYAIPILCSDKLVYR